MCVGGGGGGGGGREGGRLYVDLTVSFPKFSYLLYLSFVVLFVFVFHAILLSFHLFSTLRKVVNCVRFCMNHLGHEVSIGQFTDRQANIDTYYMHESLLFLKCKQTVYSEPIPTFLQKNCQLLAIC